ncbi:hypothetical protein EYF80_065097 [Liparis tanakae]|uniref:Uncharacterized protein n=1 Tax=Liparis tanakae TaxID=230148 RepID=A0A4Z2E7L5_9TELE|nr:hypothetical protein EYF80_065097 [Liparis tanakae]
MQRLLATTTTTTTTTPTTTVALWHLPKDGDVAKRHTLTTCGARVRTAFPSSSWPRTTSPPVGRRPCWRCWRRSSRPSGL